MEQVRQKRYWMKTIASFLLVLCMMPLGHALMIIMEKTMAPEAMHYSAFAMGAVGLALAVWGVFVKGDAKQTLLGLAGGLLFWTGWVEFIFMYYAHRYGVQPQIVDGEIVTKPEYLIMPVTFGIWVMIMTLYVFNARTGCYFITWIQKRLFGKRRDEIVRHSMTRHSSLVTFMELNMMMWSCYLLLMFCYDDNFLGDRHPVTFLVGLGCLVGAVFMFLKESKIGAWGANIRMAVATVVVFWTPVEIMGRINLFEEIWVAPAEHKTEMFIILAVFVLLIAYSVYSIAKKPSSDGSHGSGRLQGRD